MHLKKIGIGFFRISLVIFSLLNPSNSTAQAVYSCNDPLSCPEGCKEDLVTCIDPDDPVPLDSALLFLVLAGASLGVYKLYYRRQVSLYDNKN